MRLIQKIVLFIFTHASTAAVVGVPAPRPTFCMLSHSAQCPAMYSLTAILVGASVFRSPLRTGLFATVAGQLDYAFIAVSVLYGVSHAAYQNSAYPVHLILFQSSFATLLT